MEHCEMLDVLIGFSEEDSLHVFKLLDEQQEIIIQPAKLKPRHILRNTKEDRVNLNSIWVYTPCRIEVRALMGAAVAGFAGDEVEIMRLFAPSSSKVLGL